MPGSFPGRRASCPVQLPNGHPHNPIEGVSKANKTLLPTRDYAPDLEDEGTEAHRDEKFE